MLDYNKLRKEAKELINNIDISEFDKWVEEEEFMENMSVQKFPDTIDVSKMEKSKEEKQCATSVVSSSLSFKEQMQQFIIPRVWKMAEKEKEHLNWLIDNNAPKEMIETSRNYLSHFRQRHKEYVDYVAD